MYEDVYNHDRLVYEDVYNHESKYDDVEVVQGHVYSVQTCV